jgi:hypothetical protein
VAQDSVLQWASSFFQRVVTLANGGNATRCFDSNSAVYKERRHKAPVFS